MKPLTQMTLFPELGYTNPFCIRKWDLNRQASIWYCSTDQAREHIQMILNTNIAQLWDHRYHRQIKSKVRHCFYRHTWKELKLNDIFLTDCADRKILKLIQAYLKTVPEQQKQIIVTVK